jgi:hypothetical protein
MSALNGILTQQMAAVFGSDGQSGMCISSIGVQRRAIIVYYEMSNEASVDNQW